MPRGDENRQIQPTEISARLRRALEGQNEAAVGRAVNRVRSAVSAWKNGAAHPDLVTFANLCREKGWSADVLLGLKPKPAPTADQVEEAVSTLETALASARALLLGPPPDPDETSTQDLEAIDRGISERDARKGRTTARPVRANSR